MEESIAGFKRTGDWAAIVEHGERISAALSDLGVSGDDLDEWNDWRPKAEDRLREDIKERTAEQASIDEGEAEKEGNGASDELKEAGEDLSQTVEELAEGDVDDAAEVGKESLGHTARAVDTAGRKAVRTVEETVYKHVTPQLSPYYFDNPLVSANIDRTRNAKRPYTFEVNVNDDELKGAVSDRLAEYEEDIERWHIETETNTETLEDTEGVEPLE